MGGGRTTGEEGDLEGLKRLAVRGEDVEGVVDMGYAEQRDMSADCKLRTHGRRD